MFDRTLPRVLIYVHKFEHFVLFFIHIVINNLISDEQPCKMEQLKWNLINNNKSNDNNNNNNNGDDNNNDNNNNNNNNNITTKSRTVILVSEN